MVPDNRHTVSARDRAAINGGGRGLTNAYIVQGLAIVAAATIAIVSLGQSQSGKSICEYVKRTYPASHVFRKQSKGFIYDEYLHLRSEARAYRRSAAKDPDAVTARLDLLLAGQLDDHAQEALQDWRKIQLPGPPTCS